MSEPTSSIGCISISLDQKQNFLKGRGTLRVMYFSACDCGYPSALSTLVRASVSGDMNQPTSPAVSPSEGGDGCDRHRWVHRRLHRASHRSTISSVRKRTRDDDDEEVLARKVCLDAGWWARSQEDEDAVPFRIIPDYPDVRGVIPPGTRRNAVNVIYLMAHVLNLEPCTPGFGVLIMDRFLSTVDVRGCDSDVAARRRSMVTMAMMCLNVAGKIADIDRGFCGSRGVMCMIRDASPACMKMANHDEFARHVTAMECELLETLDGRMLSYPCTMQIIARATMWHITCEEMWLRAIFVHDVFDASTISTRFSKTRIAQGIVKLLSSNGERTDPVIDSILCGLSLFFDVTRGKTSMIDDPLFGVRVRHAQNTEVARVGMLYISITGGRGSTAPPD